MSNDWQNPPRHPSERDMSGLLLSEAQTGFPGHLGGIRLLKFTSDCRRFFCADLGLTVSLREEGRVLASAQLPSDGIKTKAMDRIHDFALSDEGSTAFVAAGLHLRCIDLLHGVERWRYRPDNVFGFLQSSPRAVAMTKNKYVWCCNDNGSMDLFRPEGAHVARWRASDTPNMVSQMHNGDWFVGSDGFGISVWEPEERRRILRYKSAVRVYSIKAFPREDKVAVRSDVGVSIIDLFNGDHLRTFRVLPGLPFIDVSPDGRTLLVGEGRGVAVYDLDGGQIGSYSLNGDRVLSAVFHPLDGGILAGTDSGDAVRLA